MVGEEEAGVPYEASRQAPQELDLGPLRAFLSEVYWIHEGFPSKPSISGEWLLRFGLVVVLP